MEIGDHVCPGYVSLVMYSSHIEEPLKWLNLQTEYRSLVLTTGATSLLASSEHQEQQQQQQQQQHRRGRKRRNPSKSIDHYGREQSRRQRWYDRQDKRQQQQQDHQHLFLPNTTTVLVEDDIDSMLRNILQSVASVDSLSSMQQQDIDGTSLTAVSTHRSDTPTTTEYYGFGKGVKNISCYTPPPSPPPPPRTSSRRLRRSRSYYKKLNDNRYTLLMSNVIL